MSRIFGQTSGLKALQLKKLESLYRRQINPSQLVSPELAHFLAQLSIDLNRQIGLLINRKGGIEAVILGNDQSIFIPPLNQFRTGAGRLKGLRLLHTHLKGEPISEEDKMDLALLRLDLVTAIGINVHGQAHVLYSAHLRPDNPEGQQWMILEPEQVGQSRVDVQGLVRSLEEEWGKKIASKKIKSHEEQTILVSVTTQPRAVAQESLRELEELARSAGLRVLESVIQSRKEIRPKFLMGKDRLSSLSIRALQLGANLLVFDQDLNPSQVRSLTDFTELKVIDRTQLILDIFAQRARTREGKLQVEMAQLKYILPRLVGRDDALSRLTGGIGGRGPGETRLEIDRRRVREKIHRLQKELEAIRSQRKQRRGKRNRRELPVISIVGYTNAGKSSLLNTLTHSRLAAEDRYFATLDPTSRRLRLPRDQEVIITDTVGFINNLPKDLLTAFRATLEELEEADLLLHVVDVSNAQFEKQMGVVEDLLTELKLSHIPTIRVFNKVDLISEEYARTQCARYQAIPVCALKEETLGELLGAMEQAIGGLRGCQPHQKQ
ncbi:MAG: GTPase HflX [Deltaproteobacteria bacterium]|nr:GTPase HflX [Deltaproteobacteria bacterium]